MKSYCALAILAVLFGANAQSSDDPPCSKQMELEHRCMLNVETSPEAQMIKDRMKQTMKTCAPDYPQECHAEFEAGHECATSIAKNADSDPLFKESKAQSGPAVDACFVQYPVDIKEGIMEIFMMGKPMHKGGHHGGHHKIHHNETESGESGEKHSGESGEKHSGESGESNSNETMSGEKHHGGGGKHGGGHKHCRGGRHGHHGHKNMTSGESNSNETSGERGQSGERAMCRKTPEQHQCMKDEMKKLAKDAAFVDVINTLIHQKQKCKQIKTWSCTAKCSKKEKCIMKATKPCREAFMQRMKTCLAEKGFTLPPRMLHDHTQFTTPIPDIDVQQ